MTTKDYRLTDDEFASFSKKYPNVSRSDIEDLFTKKILAEKALQAQLSEIQLLKIKALSAMGTDSEMSFSDIEAGMLKASLSDGRGALKEIMEKTPVEAPLRNDGKKMENRGRKKKHNDNAVFD